MTQNSRFFDGSSYSEANLAEVFSRLTADGVLVDITNALQVTAGSGLVSINSGEAFVQGFWYQNTASLNLAIAANASAIARVDLVVLSLDRTANTLQLAIHQGVLGAGAPAATQIAGGNWEMVLAQASIASNVITVTDVRTYLPPKIIPSARIYRTTNQSILNATSTAIIFDGVLHDNYNMHDFSGSPQNTKLLVQVPGVYKIAASLLWTSGSASLREMWLETANLGVLVDQSAYDGVAGADSMSVSTVAKLAKGDTVRFYVYQTTGGTLTTRALNYYSMHLSMVWAGYG